MKTVWLIALLAVVLGAGLAFVACGGAHHDNNSNKPDDDDNNSDDDQTIAPYGFQIVDVESETSPAVQLALQACAGLYNRQRGGSVYTIMKDTDSQWLQELAFGPAELADSAQFLQSCVTAFPCLRYSYTAQQPLLPNILTVGAVLGAVPLDEGMTPACANPAFDAIAAFAERNTPYLATQYVYENYVKETTGLAMINPGYDDNNAKVWDPPLTGDMDASLVDFVFSAKLFVTFLINGCIPATPEHALLDEIAAANPWPNPIGVYGYADYWKVFGGDLFEAQTNCVDSRNLGEIATSGVNNLSFLSSRRSPISEANEVEQNAAEDVDYDPSMTYVAFVVGDGDNVGFLMDQRSQWFQQRVADCRQTDNSCAPLTWTISPHITYLAPDVLEWYYDLSHQTGKDYFMLPPSGHLYAYPASMDAAMQDKFVAATEQDARLLGADTTIDWEWLTTWHSAETEFLPKYATVGGVIGGVFPVNVPYMFPTFTWPNANQFFKVLTGQDGGKAVLFRPREWRGVDESGAGLLLDFNLTPADMAKELGNYPAGTVAYVYMTSDGGLTIENAFLPLVKLLPAHVRLVSTAAAVRLALDASQNGADAK
jgi:hypothetical protein